MLDFAPSPSAPRFAFDAYDRVCINGIEYRAVDTTEDGYIFVRLDGCGVADSYSRSEMARLVDLGVIRHERDALRPEGAKARLRAQPAMLSGRNPKKHREAKFRESVVHAFFQLEREGKVRRTEASIKAALPEICSIAGDILTEPFEEGGGPANAKGERRRKFPM